MIPDQTTQHLNHHIIIHLNHFHDYIIRMFKNLINYYYNYHLKSNFNLINRFKIQY
jgi:hypothetical protein